MPQDELDRFVARDGDRGGIAAAEAVLSAGNDDQTGIRLRY